ncbi:FixH family protein [Pusillimonas sp.]|uniref:FixH family protein n=1 Tax=Pusillimonas sp. TaxID=3040095 RepID=UPI0037CAA82C
MSETNKSKPWWREPWPWILMAGPAAAIVGCVITIGLAVQNFADQPITDGGSKKGLVIERGASAAAAAGAEATGDAS